MRTTQQLSITLPHKMAKLVRSKVASGEYATESEVVREGLRALADRDEALEHWLRTKVVPAAEAIKRDPSRGLSPAQVRASLKKHAKQHAKPRAKK
jgi:antitoxin ParD1/3/4